MAIDRTRYTTSRFLRAADLTTLRTTATITGVREELLGEDKKPKVVVEFTGLKPLVANLTNLDALCALFGDEETAWLGRSVTLVKSRAAFQGRQVDAVRVEAAEMRGTAAAGHGGTADIPF